MGCSFWPGSLSLAARLSAPSNNDNPRDFVGMSGPNGSLFANNFGIDGWKEAVEQKWWFFLSRCW